MYVLTEIVHHNNIVKYNERKFWNFMNFRITAPRIYDEIRTHILCLLPAWRSYNSELSKAKQHI